MKKTIAIILAVFAAVCIAGVPGEAHAAQLTAGTAETVAKFAKVDGNTYQLYDWGGAALHKVGKGKKNVTIPDKIAAGGKKYTVEAVHVTAKFKKCKRITIKAKHLQTVEPGELFKYWRAKHHCKLKVKVTDKATRKWLEAAW